MSNPRPTVPSATTPRGRSRLSVGLLPWLIFAALLFAVALYFVSAEQGATSLIGGTALHEWTHDGRHLLGFPCH